MTDQNLDRETDEEAGDAPVEAGETEVGQQASTEHEQAEARDEADSASGTDV